MEATGCLPWLEGSGERGWGISLGESQSHVVPQDKAEKEARSWGGGQCLTAMRHCMRRSSM